MKHKKILALLLCSTMLLFSVTGCTNTIADSNTKTNENTGISTNISVNSSINRDDMFTDRDMEIGYDETFSTKIVSENNTVITDGNGVNILGNTITITDEGTYIVKGVYNEYQILVDTEKSNKVQIVLDNAQITNSSTATVYVKKADKVFITLANGSDNTLSVTGEFIAIDDNKIDAVVFSKSDLTLNGNGKLNVVTKSGNAITSKDDLVITSGIFSLSASGHGLEGKDSVRIANGDFTIESGKDGIHSENKDDTSKGFIYIANGTFNINCEGDGIDASATADIDNGTFTIITAGGSEKAPAHVENDFRGFGFNQQNNNNNTNANNKNNNTNANNKDNNNINSNKKDNSNTNNNSSTNNTNNTTTTTSASTKGIKATGILSINGGQFSIDSYDDSIHSNDSITINNGLFEISTGDDGIHADNNVCINQGQINIAKSYEGIEGQSIDINGGTITLIASDDGLNAAGGNDSNTTGGFFGRDSFSADENAYIKINGGNITVIAGGDGIDSNGSLTVTGGETYVHGPTDNGNGALDYDSTANITGGIIIAAGASGMAQNFDNSSTQASMLVNTQNMQSGAVVVKDDAGNEIVNFMPQKQYNSVVISSPEIKVGKTYTVTLGDDTQTVEMTDTIYGTEGGMGGFGHGHDGQRPDGFNKQNGQRPTNDGTQPQAPSDGTQMPTPPDGTQMPTPPDGTQMPTPPDGTQMPTPPDGTQMPTPPDGTQPPTKNDNTDGTSGATQKTENNKSDNNGNQV